MQGVGWCSWYARCVLLIVLETGVSIGVIGAAAAAAPQDSPLSSSAVREVIQSWYSDLHIQPRFRERQILLVWPAIKLPAADEESGTGTVQAITQIVDGVPFAMSDYTPTNLTVGEIYELILDYGQPAPFVLNDDQRRVIANLEATLLQKECTCDGATITAPRKRSVRVNCYFELARSYARAKDLYDQQQTSIAQAELDRAMKEWNLLGFKSEIESALEQYTIATSLDPHTRWFDARRRFEYGGTILRTGRRTTQTLMVPDVSDWVSEIGWISIADSDGLFSAQVKRVVIVRPWIDYRLLFDIAWTWSHGMPLGGNYVVSDGNGIESRTSPAGSMPLLPVEIILARAIRTGSDASGIDLAPKLVGVVCEALPRLPAKTDK